MGSWTSFLNLFKPAKTDSYNVITQQDDNWDKIDVGVSALNSNKADWLNLSSGTVRVGTLDAIKTAFLNKINSMSNSTVSFMVIEFTAAVSEFPAGGSWICKINKATANYQTIICEYMTGYNASAIYPVYVENENGTWYFNNLNSKLGNFELVKAVKEPAPGDGNHVAEYMIPANSQRMYMFSALYDPNQGVFALVIVASNGTVYVQNVTTQYTITATYSDGKLTITIPFGGYCRVSLMRIY